MDTGQLSAPVLTEEQQQQQDDANRYWREEKEEGAVYACFLKKVTYLSQARLEDENVTKTDFAHLMWETHKVRVIKSGNLAKLVQSLTTCTGEMDSSFVNVFLATYRTFASVTQALTAVTDRYVELESESLDDKTEFHEQQLRSLKSVLFVWLDSYPEDFHEGPEFTCLRRLGKFAHDHAPESGIAAKVKNVMEAFRQQDVEDAAKQLGMSFSLTDGRAHPVDTDSSKSLALLDISCRKIAEQLTFRDAELFGRVVPHHCLGAVWSRRDKVGGSDAPSIQATIQQFNSISLRVIATILKTQELKLSKRAQILHKWIIIAQDLRELKNFSSLKAIITGLQSHPVYRLKKTWHALSKDSLVLFEELSEIFSVDNNQLNSREILMKEATAKLPDLGDSKSKSLKRRNIQKRRSWVENGIVQGTVPYLGTFLTDLTMVDSALSDYTEEGLVNFEKKRKEFEVLAQLKLLQVAASIYSVHEDESFWRWFNSIKTYSDTESHDLSCSLESPSESSSKLKKKSASLGTKPSKLEHPKLMGGGEAKSVVSIPDSLNARPMLSHSSSTSSVISSDSDNASSSLTPFKCSDSYVIKVSIDSTHNDLSHVYKSIMLSNSDHTPVVIEKILDKYCIHDLPDNYCLLQLLPDGELLIPERANVFYALNSSVDLKFTLRSREAHQMLKDKKRSGRRSGRKIGLSS